MQINGPFNIQFIAKDNELKVIECNLRVSRTFPFVSKTMNINLIQIATQVMLGKLKMNIPKKIKTNRVGVKVPMFSFSRLKGADVSLGVEMVSTGEVACFGENAWEAYLKGIQASDVKLPPPNGNVLISIGPFRMKKEFTDSVRMLEQMGYTLYGTTGSYDYYETQNIKIKALSTNQILEYLKNKQIDLVINISNKIRFQLPSNTTLINSDGYWIRRMTIDNKIPLITNIKNGKLYIKALHNFHGKNYQVWCDPKIDCFTSYQTIRLPGLIDTHVHLREPGASYKEDWETGTQAALAGGITMIGVMPNTDPPIVDRESQKLVKGIARNKAYCDYGIYMGANLDNYKLWKEQTDLADGAIALKMYLNNTYGPLLLDNTQIWSEHLKNWPLNRPICVHAEKQTLASLLYMAYLAEGRSIHVCHVASKEEIMMIKAGKERGLSITCEVAPHHLFLSTLNKNTKCSNTLPTISENFAEVKPPLASHEDQEALWDNLDIIDCFATDHAPHTREDKECHKCPGFPGLETALPLLLTAVADGRLTIDDIILKYHTNPKKIFGLPDQEETYIEVDLDHKWVIPDKLRYTKCGWSPFAGMKVQGLLRRVVMRGKTVYVDGEVLSIPGFGKNIREYVKEDKVNILRESNSKMLELQIKEEIDRRHIVNHDKLHLRNLLSVDQLDRRFLRELFINADKMEKIVGQRGICDSLKDKILGSIFYEPSTRTRCSFTVAMQRLGGKVIEISKEGSSVQKGESFGDFMKTMECYADLLVIRSDEKDLKKALPKDLSIPIINAGDGAGEHPTQALLDLYTMRKEKGTVTGKTVALVGDLKNGRTSHSLAKLLTLYENVRLIYISQEGMNMPREVYNYVDKYGIEQVETKDLMEYLPKIDILYMTRMQLERGSVGEYYRLDSSMLTQAKDDLVLMHPLPRVDEISVELDSDPRSAYFRQMENGLYIRMALLEMMMK